MTDGELNDLAIYVAAYVAGWALLVALVIALRHGALRMFVRALAGGWRNLARALVALTRPVEVALADVWRWWCRLPPAQSPAKGIITLPVPGPPAMPDLGYCPAPTPIEAWAWIAARCAFLEQPVTALALPQFEADLEAIFWRGETAQFFPSVGGLPPAGGRVAPQVPASYGGTRHVAGDEVADPDGWVEVTAIGDMQQRWLKTLDAYDDLTTFSGHPPGEHDPARFARARLQVVTAELAKMERQYAGKALPEHAKRAWNAVVDEINGLAEHLRAFDEAPTAYRNQAILSKAFNESPFERPKMERRP